MSTTDTTTSSLTVSLTAGLMLSDRAALFFELDREIADSKAQVNRGLNEMVEGMFRLARSLVRMRSTQAYRDQFDTFENYCQQRHGIDSKTARFYIQPLETFGEDTYRALLLDHGRKKSFYLAQVFQLKPELFAYLTMPNEDGVAPVASMSGKQLEGEVQDLRTQLRRAAQENQDLLSALEREQTLGRTISGRIEKIEEINRNVIAAQDQEKRAAQRLQQDVTRMQSTIRELERNNHQLQSDLAAARSGSASRAVGALPAPRPALPAGPTVTVAAASAVPPPAPARPVSVVDERDIETTVVVREIIDTCDPAMVADLVRLCAQSLERYQRLIPSLPEEHSRQLYATLADLVRGGDPRLLALMLQAGADVLRQLAVQPGQPQEDLQSVRLALRDLVAVAASLSL